MNQANNTVSGNGNKRSLSIAIEDDPEQSNGAFYDPGNPVFAPPKEVDVTKRKGRKRKLATATVVLFLVLGGLGALYLLLRVSSVNVKVQADPRRNEQQKTNDKADPNGSDNGLTAEAINIARSAAGSDRAVPNSLASPSPNPSTSSSPPPSIGSSSKPNYSVTDSPVFEKIREGSSKNEANGSYQSANAPTSQTRTANEVASNEAIQSRANPTQTLFVDDSLQRPTALALHRAQFMPRDDTKNALTLKSPPAVLPPFGTMLPVRTQGVIFTLRNNSYARFELTRHSEGVGWSLPKGTTLIGRVSGSEYDRAFVTIVGYLDSRDNRFVKIAGEVLGSDGASGIQGKRVVVNQEGLKRAFRKIASSGLQVAGMMAGALTGRGTVVIDSAGYRLMNPITDEAGRMVGSRADEKRSFVKVDAGRPGYVMVADLPKNAQAIDAPGEDELTLAAATLTDREVMELILFGTPEEIRAALPLMSDEQKRLVSKALSNEGGQR